MKRVNFPRTIVLRMADRLPYDLSLYQYPTTRAGRSLKTPRNIPKWDILTECNRILQNGARDILNLQWIIGAMAISSDTAMELSINVSNLQWDD